MPEVPLVQISAGGLRAAVRLKSYSPNPDGVSFVPPELAEVARQLNMGPGECLLVSNVIEGPRLCASIERFVLGKGIAAADLSSGIKSLRVEGLAAAQLLSKGCGLDFHQRVFPAGSCTRTRFAQLSVIVDCIAAQRSYELYVGRSWLEYLRSWLGDAAEEFAPVPP